MYLLSFSSILSGHVVTALNKLDCGDPEQVTREEDAVKKFDN